VQLPQERQQWQAERQEAARRAQGAASLCHSVIVSRRTPCVTLCNKVGQEKISTLVRLLLAPAMMTPTPAPAPATETLPETPEQLRARVRAALLHGSA